MQLAPKEIPISLKPLIRSREEEIANMLSHALGILIFIIAIPFLLNHFSAAESSLFWGMCIFSISLMMVYTSSTAYHSVYTLRWKKRLRTWDHICIYFLIAGSYTPFIIATKAGNGIMITLWIVVLIGIVFKLFFTNRFNLASTLAYILMGCLGFFIYPSLVDNSSDISLIWIAIGGVSYIVGSVFYLWKKLYFGHFIWHLFVLLGSISHFIAAYYIVF